MVVATESAEARAAESSKLLNWALQSFDTPALRCRLNHFTSESVYAANAVNVGFLEAAYITCTAAAGKLIACVGNRKLWWRRFRKAEYCMTLKVMSEGQVLAEKTCGGANAVEEAGWFGRMYDGVVLCLKICLPIINHAGFTIQTASFRGGFYMHSNLC